MTTFLGQLVDLYAVLTKYFAMTQEQIDQVPEDEGLKASIGRYAIGIGSITERVYQQEMEVPVENMKRYLDGILHFYDEGQTKISVPELFGMVEEAEHKLDAKEAKHEAKGI